jgi:hypothetical protein
LRRATARRWRAAAWTGLLLAFASAAASEGRVAPSAAAVTPLAVGATLPDVSLRTPADQPVALRDLTGNGPVALVFYRGGW